MHNVPMVVMALHYMAAFIWSKIQFIPMMAKIFSSHYSSIQCHMMLQKSF